MRHKVWLMDPQHPLRVIREVECEIIVCDKTTWAQRMVGARTKRHLLGTSAFYTVKAAERAKRGALEKLAKLHFPHWHPAGQMGDRARDQLAKYAATGTFH